MLTGRKQVLVWHWQSRTTGQGLLPQTLPRFGGRGSGRLAKSYSYEQSPRGVSVHTDPYRIAPPRGVSVHTDPHRIAPPLHTGGVWKTVPRIIACVHRTFRVDFWRGQSNEIFSYCRREEERSYIFKAAWHVIDIQFNDSNMLSGSLVLSKTPPKFEL